MTQYRRGLGIPLDDNGDLLCEIPLSWLFDSYKDMRSFVNNLLVHVEGYCGKPPHERVTGKKYDFYITHAELVEWARNRGRRINETYAPISPIIKNSRILRHYLDTYGNITREWV